MKLKDIFEMTWRTGSNMDSMPFPKFEDYELTFEGKMEGGLPVYSFPWKDTVIYGVKVNDDFAAFSQMRPTSIPNFGEVLESLNSKTQSAFRGSLLSYKLRFFLTRHLGKHILLGNIHSIATENVLSKIRHLFELKMLNVKTGETVEWSREKYNELTSEKRFTDWQVLMIGSERPLKESVVLDWDSERRHLWTYGNFFGEFESE